MTDLMYLISQHAAGLRRPAPQEKANRNMKAPFSGAGMAVLLSLSAVLMGGLSPSANASTAWGSLNNFDAVNDTADVCHWLEIESEDNHRREISYTYDWNHYGVPKISEDNSDPSHPRVFVRYESARKPDGSWAAHCGPCRTYLPNGWSPVCQSVGQLWRRALRSWFFGTPASVKYNWLKDDGAGNLIHAGAVNIATPTFGYIPPAAAPAQVVARLCRPPPEPPVLEFGPACWVKDTKTKTHNNNKVELRDLVSDDPDDPNDRNWKNGEPDEVETEWRILQTQFTAEDGGANGELVGQPEELPEGDAVVTRRYDFYKYVGPFDAESGEAMADEVGPDGVHGVGAVTYNDHIDPTTGEWVEVEVDLSTVVVVGDYIGAQMAGFDPAAQIGLIDHLQDGELNVPYIERTIVIGGTPPVITTRTGALPDGMTFDVVSGVLSGTPTVASKFTFDIESTDATGAEVRATYNLTILNADIVEPPHITVTTLASPAMAGATSGDGEYVEGTEVVVTSTPNAGFAFLNWTDGGTVVSTSAEYRFTAEVNRELVANFVPTYTIETSASPTEGGTTGGGGTFVSGESVTVQASANDGYSFVNWTEGEVIVSSSANYTFTASVDRELVANFVANPPVTIQGDLDGDADVDRTDLGLIVAARNTLASEPNDPCDLDHDGKITVLDARILVTLFTRPGGATQ
jgi:hypothetical protein